MLKKRQLSPQAAQVAAALSSDSKRQKQASNANDVSPLPLKSRQAAAAAAAREDASQSEPALEKSSLARGANASLKTSPTKIDSMNNELFNDDERRVNLRDISNQIRKEENEIDL